MPLCFRLPSPACGRGVGGEGSSFTQTMNVLITTQPGVGHFYPLVPLAEALISAGHTVRVASAESFVPRIERHGLSPITAGLDWLQAEPEIAFPEVAEMSSQEREFFFIDLFTDMTASYMAQDLLDYCESWRPDLIIRDAYEYGGCLLGEVLDIPHVAVDMDLYIPLQIQKQGGMGKQFAYLRSAFGLASQNGMHMLERHGYISNVPRSYQTYEPPEGTLWLQPMIMNASADQLPSWFASLPDRPIVYASMGTSFNNVPFIFRTIIDGLADEDVTLIVTVGRSQDPKQFDPLPDNVFVEQFIPQAALMPFCKLVIANGGIGTNLIALNYGVPILTVPLSGQLALNAQAVASVGAGDVLMLPAEMYETGDDAILDADHFAQRLAAQLVVDEVVFSAETIRSTVHALLQNKAIYKAAATIGHEITQMDSAELIVTKLEQLCLTQPIVA